MNWEKVGNYLDREVEIAHNKQLLEWTDNYMENSVLLLYFDFINKFLIQDLNLLIKKIIKTSPLVIAIAGKEKKLIFDILLKRLSEIKNSNHIMSKICEDKNIKDILEDFFIATWPTEKSFDNWKRYSIIFWGGTIKFLLFKKKLKGFLK